MPQQKMAPTAAASSTPKAAPLLQAGAGGGTLGCRRGDQSSVPRCSLMRGHRSSSSIVRHVHTGKLTSAAGGPSAPHVRGVPDREPAGSVLLG